MSPPPPPPPVSMCVCRHPTAFVVIVRPKWPLILFVIRNKQKRKKTTIDSPLLGISGVGQKTIKKIFTNYDGTADLANQTPDSIFKKIGLSKKISQEVISVSKSLQNKL